MFNFVVGLFGGSIIMVYLFSGISSVNIPADYATYRSEGVSVIQYVSKGGRDYYLFKINGKLYSTPVDSTKALDK